MRVLIITSKATSLFNVAKDIAYVLMKKKHTPRIMVYLTSYLDVADLCDAIIMIYPASPLYCTPQFLFYRDWKHNIKKPILFYTTIEGKPVSRHLHKWMVRDLEFITVSRYVYDKLTSVGLKVIDIVPHGLVKEQVDRARGLVPTARKNLKKLHGDKVIFGAIAFYHLRKGLEYLAKAVEILNKKRDDFVVHLVTDQRTKSVLGSIPNLYIDTVFGTREREEILAFLGACDYVIIPSFAEGFGLPLLEANAMGTPCIHASYPPLTEISDSKYNLTFEYVNVKNADIGEGIEYELHIYDPNDMAKTMDYAIDLLTNDINEYIRRCERVKKVINEFNAEKCYSKLIKYLTG